MKTKNLKEYSSVGSLYVSKELLKFVNNEVLKGTKIKPKNFWSGFEKSLQILKPKNEKLIDLRESIQKKIDDWHIQNKDNEFNLTAYKKFLYSIDYLKKEGKNFKIQTENVDEEISKTPGPQLVVPISNARYALNAANARWGSLYDALYGTDAIGSEKLDNRYNPVRGGKVINYCRNFLDEIFPLKNASWKKLSELKIFKHKLILKIGKKNYIFER